MSHRGVHALDGLAHPLVGRWWGTLAFIAAFGIAYFLAAWLGLALRGEPAGLAFFWPAAGVAVGTLIVLGPGAWPAGAIAIATASAAINFLIGRHAGLIVIFALANVAQALLTAWIVERWFGRAMKLSDLRQVLVFLGASAVGASVVALGAGAVVALLQGSSSSPLPVLCLLYAGCLLGVVTVAPVIIGLDEARNRLPPKRELIDGGAGLATLAVLSVVAIGLSSVPWATSLPEILVFCPLLWVAVRCRPVFSAAGALLVALAVIWSRVHHLGLFGNEGIPVLDSLFATQSFVLGAALVSMLLAALFAERRQIEAALKSNNELLRDSNERLELVLGAAELGVFSLDIHTGLLECDARSAYIHGHTSLPRTIKDGRRFIHHDDRACIDERFAQAWRADGAWNAEYRVVHPPGHALAGEVRWIAFEGAIVRGSQPKSARLLGVSRDITHRKQSEKALAERNMQLALAGKSGLVGSYAYDHGTDMMHVSEGYVAIHGLPDGTTKNARSECDAHTYADDLARIRALRDQAVREQRGEYDANYRIVCRGGAIRWVESRSFISYDANGKPQQTIGVNIDITERKRAEEALAERNIQFELAQKVARVGSYAYDIGKNVMRLSRASAAIYGLSQNPIEVSGMDWRDRIHRDDVDRLQLERHRSFKARQPELMSEFRIVRPGGEVRWIESRTQISYDSAGRATSMVGVYIDVTERKRTEQTLLERSAQLDLANKAGLVGGYSYDYATDTLRLGAGTAAIYGLPEGTEVVTAEEWRRCMHADDVLPLVAQSRRAIREQRRELVCVFRIIRNDEMRWIETRNRFSYDHTGRATQAIGVSIDVTERRQAEDHKAFLIAELDHRVKNTLACVSAIAQRAREVANSADEYFDMFDGRLQSLANTHTLLSRSRWHGAKLVELVRGELAPCGKDDSMRIAGPEISLSPEAAQTVAMVLHELATNAAKYGALSVEGGRVSVSWNHTGDAPAQSVISIQWKESGGPAVERDIRPGYGTSIIRDLIPYELGGTVDLVHASAGVRCRMDIPSRWLRSTRATSTEGQSPDSLQSLH